MSAHALSLQLIAKTFGGEVSGQNVLIPGPGHSPKDRSLSVKLAPDRELGIEWHSYAGDAPRDVLRYLAGRLGLEAKVPVAPAKTVAPDWREASAHEYHNADGEPVYRVRRLEDRAPENVRPSGKRPKTIRQDHWNGSAWVSGLNGCAPLLYRLPGLIASVREDETVFIVEGEGKADLLASWGLVATCNSGGAGKWDAAFADYLKDRDVVILPDNDEPGWGHAEAVAKAVSGSARRVTVLSLPGLGQKEDVVDWAKRGGNRDMLIDLVNNAAEWSERARKTDIADYPKTHALTFLSTRVLMRKSFPPMKWIVPGFLPEGCTIFAGKPKVGKSWVMLDINLAVGSGNKALSGVKCEQGDALYLALEDNERRLQSRLLKLRADERSRLSFLTQAPRLGEGLEDLIRKWAASVERPRLVTLDTLAMVRPPTKPGNQAYLEDYGAVAKCRDLAAELGIAVVIVHHTRKMAGEDPFDDVSGTLGLSGAADASAIIRRDGAGTKLYLRGRDVEEAEHALQFDHKTCRFSVLGAAADVRRSDERRAILDAIEEAGEPLGPTQIADVTGMPSNNVRPLLLRMVRAGEVAKTERGKYGRPADPDHVAAVLGEDPGNNGNMATLDDDGDDE
jgi:hypothetical protein